MFTDTHTDLSKEDLDIQTYPLSVCHFSHSVGVTIIVLFPLKQRVEITRGDTVRPYLS